MKLLISAEDACGLSPAQFWDIRGKATYLQGHWPGAFPLDVKHWENLARSSGYGLDQRAPWVQEFCRIGIDGTVPVVVYDDGRMTEAARAWFILQLHGVDARVVDGGWTALVRVLPASGPDTNSHTPTPTAYDCPAGHEPIVNLVTRHVLRDRLLGQVQVLDARTAAEFSGQDLRSNARGGHLPGAKSLPHAELLGSDGTLKGPDQLRMRLLEAGLHLEKPVVTHCDAGGRGALAALAAVAAGHREVSAYYLSYSDWAADGTCEVSLE